MVAEPTTEVVNLHRKTFPAPTMKLYGLYLPIPPIAIYCAKLARGEYKTTRHYIGTANWNDTLNRNYLFAISSILWSNWRIWIWSVERATFVDGWNRLSLDYWNTTFKRMNLGYIPTWITKLCVYLAIMQLKWVNRLLLYGHRCLLNNSKNKSTEGCSSPLHQWPLLLTWFNFNPSMDK